MALHVCCGSASECLAGRLVLDNGSAAEVDVWITSAPTPTNFAHGASRWIANVPRRLLSIFQMRCLHSSSCPGGVHTTHTAHIHAHPQAHTHTHTHTHTHARGAHASTPRF